MFGSGLKCASQWWPGEGYDIGLPCGRHCKVWRRDATRVTVFMDASAASWDLLAFTTWDMFQRRLFRWRNMVVSDSVGCWDLQGQERAIPTLPPEVITCSVIVLARTVQQQVGLHSLEGWFTSCRCRGTVLMSMVQLAEALLPVLVGAATELGTWSACHIVDRMPGTLARSKRSSLAQPPVMPSWTWSQTTAARF